MANREIVVKCKTRLAAKGVPVSSTVTIVLDSEKDVDAFAGRSAIIAWQAIERAAGGIPATDKVMISELAKRAGGGGFKVTPESLANRVRKMPVDEYRATLVNLGVSAKDIERMVNAHASVLSPATTIGAVKK